MKNGLTPRKYQKDIFEFVDKGHGNLVIEAVAGAGKTTTIINCLAFVPKGKRVLFAAFNRDIVETLKERVHDVRPDASVFTLHGLGFRMLKRAMDDDIELDEFKYKTHIQKNLDELSGFDVKNMGYPFYSTYKANVEKLVDFGRYYLVETKTEMDRLCERYGITPLDNECDVALLLIDYAEADVGEAVDGAEHAIGTVAVVGADTDSHAREVTIVMRHIVARTNENAVCEAMVVGCGLTRRGGLRRFR